MSRSRANYVEGARIAWIEIDESDEALKTIQRHARTIKRSEDLSRGRGGIDACCSRRPD
jgi:hypothetical protein